jgi:hypothetical protein
LLVTSWPVVVLVIVAVTVVVPAVVADSRPALPLAPLPMVATVVFDEVQLTAVVTSWLADMLAYAKNCRVPGTPEIVAVFCGVVLPWVVVMERVVTF